MVQQNSIVSYTSIDNSINRSKSNLMRKKKNGKYKSTNDFIEVEFNDVSNHLSTKLRKLNSENDNGYFYELANEFE